MTTDDPKSKVFHCHYHLSGSYGFFENHDIIVVAESASRAHTWAVMDYPNTSPMLWRIEEIPTNKDGSHHISSDCS